MTAPLAAADVDTQALGFAFEFHIAMTTLLGTRWTTKHGEAPSPEWQRLLARFAHMDPEQLAAKIVGQLKPNGRGEVWPPEMADVIAMAQPKPEDFGLPTAEQAYRDASHQRWERHPVVYETARRVGVHEVRTEARSRPAFEREFAEVCAEWMAGTRFQAPRREPAQQLPLHPKRRLTPEEAKAKCDELRRAIGPLPAPLDPEPAPLPLNDQDVAALNEHRSELEQLAKQYRRSA